jgi:hypothetical protein
MMAFKCLSPAHVRTRYAPNGTGILTGLSWELRYFKYALNALVRTMYAGVVGWKIEFEIFPPKSMCVPRMHQVITVSSLDFQFEIFLPKSMCVPRTHQVITLSSLDFLLF